MQAAKEQQGQADNTSADADPQETSPPKTAATPPPIKAWSAEEFSARTFPPKEPLLQGLLHRRDLVALGARRRNGKTSLITNIAVALAIPIPQFLGYDIPEARRSLLFILEDDPGEYQEKLLKVIGGRDTGGRIKIVTREDFQAKRIRIDVSDPEFKSAVAYWVLEHKPDVITFDNLAQLIGAEYNDPKRVHELTHFCYLLAITSPFGIHRSESMIATTPASQA